MVATTHTRTRLEANQDSQIKRIQQTVDAGSV
jgi:hypothetical protein